MFITAFNSETKRHIAWETKNRPSAFKALHGSVFYTDWNFYWAHKKRKGMSHAMSGEGASFYTLAFYLLVDDLYIFLRHAAIDKGENIADSPAVKAMLRDVETITEKNLKKHIAELEWKN